MSSLSFQIRTYQRNKNGAHNQHGGHDHVGPHVTEVPEQEGVQIGEDDAEELGGGVQKSRGSPFRFRISQLCAELESHRKQAGHEEARREIIQGVSDLLNLL